MNGILFFGGSLSAAPSALLMRGTSLADLAVLISELPLFLLLFSPLIVTGIVFVICLVRFLRAEKGAARRGRLTGLIVSAVVCGCILSLYVFGGSLSAAPSALLTRGTSLADLAALISELSLFLLLFSPLIVTGIVFVICLVRFLRAEKGTARRGRLTGLIVSAVVCGCILSLYVGLIILLCIGIMGM